MRFGYKLATEGFDPKEIVRQAVAAEAAGFDFVELSDHYHPWLESQGHSGFTWSMLAAIAARTDRLELATGVTCPSFRYHPAIIAQAAATMAILSDGRFTLGVGAGERLNEHIVGDFPGIHVRHERFREALEIINLLWQGGYRSYEGKHLRLDDARVFDLPPEPPVMAVAVSGPASVHIAAELGTGLFATEPKGELIEEWHKVGGSGPSYVEAPLAWAPDEQTAVDTLLEKNRWMVSGWKVMAELPNPVNFEAATEPVRPEDMAGAVPHGPDPEPYLQAIEQWTEAGYDHLCFVQVGDDQERFFRFWEDELKPRLAE
jgi:G6PDH family F420-dependent oxidoreductase